MTLPLGTASDAPVVLDLSTAEAHPTATVSLRDGALQGTTSAGAWSYAVYLPVLIHDPKEHDHVLKVSVELTVTAGRVGVGILNAAEDAFVTERHVPPAERVVTVELLAPRKAGFGRMVFRNACVDNTPSQFTVWSVAAEWCSRLWPVDVEPRDITTEDIPAGGDYRVFDEAEAVRINRARIQMIGAVGLPLAGARVLDVGCGVGRFADYYASQGCDVVAVDARPENIAELHRRYPSVRAIVGDAEVFDFETLGQFDVVHCFGLLYHLENPLAALRNLSRVCTRVLLLETMIVDSKRPMLLLADETKAASQALGGIGCRPSPSFVAMSLNRIGFPRVYGLQPDGEHEDFDFEWRDDNEHTRDGHPLRCVFVASRRPLAARRLVTLVADTAEAADEQPWTPGVSSLPFSLERHVAHNGATVSGTAPIVVQTPPQPWAYALSFLPAWPRESEAIDGMIRVRIRVLEGEISLLCVSGDRTRIIDETFVAASEQTAEATLIAAPLTACGGIVLRTASALGAASSAEIYSIDSVPIGASDHGNRLSPPRELGLKLVPDWSRYYGGRGATLDERLRSARYAALDRVKTMSWLEGLDLLIRPNEELSRAVYISGTYEPASLLATRLLLRPGDVFFDVGANVGLYSMLASRWSGPYGRVFSFEPSEREFRHLREHLELNGLVNVTTIRSAVVDHDGIFDLRVAEFPHAGHNTITETFVYDAVVAKHTERVEGITLDRFASESRLEHVDLVKVDVEGGEHAVLAGATKLLRDWRPSWIIEVSGHAIESREHAAIAILDMFREGNYRVFRLDAPNVMFSELRSGDPLPPGNLVAVPLERQHLVSTSG
jgi:FkbM family methyltransferase